MAEEDIQETTPNPEGGEATAVAEPPAAAASDNSLSLIHI